MSGTFRHVKCDPFQFAAPLSDRSRVPVRCGEARAAHQPARIRGTPGKQRKFEADAVERCHDIGKPKTMLACVALVSVLERFWQHRGEQDVEIE